MMRWTRSGACLLASLFTSVGAWAGEAPALPQQPPPGTFRMRNELKGVHPRLYFTRADIPRIKALANGEGKFFVEQMKRGFAGPYTGKDIPDPLPREEGWKAYLYGFWGLFSFDMLWLVEENPRYLATAKKWALQLARKDWWIRDDIAPSDSLAGLALTYDILYDRFTEGERKEIRRSIHKRLEFLSKRFFVPQYWTRDYQNNHMHNRIHGLAHGAFAIYGDDPEFDVQPFADLAIAQVDNMLKWLPEDGSQHEGPGYWSFGHNWAARVVHLAEHVTGRDLASANPHMETAHMFRIYMTAPGWMHTLNIGDGGDGDLGCPTSLLPGIREARDAHAMAVVHRLMEVNPESFYRYPAWGLLWYDASIKPRPYGELPLWRFWPDLEMFSIRSSWADDATAFVFKCGPVGGHKLQKLRGQEWANVAHDHPDQNHFLLFAHGKMLAEDDGYPHQKKLTRSHNTITVDGKGQPREGTGWQQPFDYALSGRLQDVFLAHDTAFAAGDAGRLYEGVDKFVRHVAFVGGEYVIVLDELEGTGDAEHEYEWRLHKDGEWQKVGLRRFVVFDKDVGTAGGAAATAGAEISLGVHFLLPTHGGVTTEFLPTELTAKPCLSVKHRAKDVRFLAVLVPQKNGMPELKAQLAEGGRDTALQVTGRGRRDVVIVADRPGGPAGMDDLHVVGAAAIVQFKDGAPAQAHLVRGSRLTVRDRLLLGTVGANMIGALQIANLSWRKVQGHVVVEAEAPYGLKGTPILIRIGGLEAGNDYPVFIDGEHARNVRSDARGVVTVQADLSARRIIQIGGERSVVPYARPAAR